MNILQQFNILLACFSALLGIATLIFLYRASHRFYPSRKQPYNLLKFGFISFLFGHLYALFVIIYSIQNDLAKDQKFYLAIAGIVLMLLGMVCQYLSQKKLAAGQQNPDIINALKHIHFGQYFLLVPFLCIGAHFIFNTPVIVWLVASIVGFILIIIGSYQLREVKLLGLAETIIIINLIAFVLFIFLLSNYAANNLKDRFLDIEINTFSDSVDNHITKLDKETFANYSDEANQAKLRDFTGSIKTDKVKNVIIWDMEGRVIYSDQENLINFSSLNFDNDYIQAKKGNIVYQLFDQKTNNIYSGLSQYQLKYYYPVEIGETETQTGVVALFIDSPATSQNAWLSRFMVWTIVIGFLVFFIIMMIVDLAVLRNAVIRPLQKISNQAKNIVEHNDYREHTVIAYESEDEIGQIAKAINKITYRLHSLEEKKEEKNWN